MKISEKLNARRFERYWEKKGRKDMFTWVHRYLRLHIELLDDSVYQEIYDYYRNTLIEYVKKDIGDKKIDNEKLGELVDTLANIINKDHADVVNKYKVVVDEIYDFWKRYPNIPKDIHI
ncbi:MAG: hypothetical protein E7347_00375 [Clostridiales bacterium]|nr:hypothetical protein [Clostridiales bacterium]